MALPNNIVAFDGSNPKVSGFALGGRYRNTVKACRQVLSRNLPVLMNGMFENLDDSLYEMADKADSNRVQTSYFDAMREVRKQRQRIETSFQSRMLDNFDRFWKTGSWGLPEKGPSEPCEEDGLSLMNQNDLEEDLAIGTMTSRGENRYFRELYDMDQRFSLMAGGFELDTKNNPLAPAAICAAFKGAAGELALELQFKLVIYKQFERKIIDALGGLYTETNGLLVKSDILPTLSPRARRKTYHGRPVGNGVSRGGSGGQGYLEGQGGYSEGQGYSEDQEDFQAELFSSLQSLLSTYRPMPMPAGVVNDPQLPAARPSDVLAILSSMQNTNPVAMPFSESGQTVDFDVRASLLQNLQSGQSEDARKRIEKSDQDAIDVIAMLFEFILEDQNLPDAMRALLARLQIPMLKVAIIDKEFFSRKSHPARRLLNSMAQAAVGWSEENGRLEGGLYGRMESMVQRIMNQFDDDIDLFTELYEDFSDFLRHEEQGSRIAEQRTTQITEGREQLKTARHQVFEEINNRLLARDRVPEVVVTLLKDGWKDVLLLICLRKGLDSPEWSAALETMDKLLWSVEFKEEQEQRQELLKAIPQLLKSLRIGLNDISYDQHKMARLFKDLQSCHLDGMKGNPLVSSKSTDAIAVWNEQEQRKDSESARPVNVAVEGAGNETGSPKPVEAGAVVEDIDDEHSRAAETLAIGTWLQIAQDEDTQVRAKLSWRSRMSKTCLFVNRKGMKVAEVSLPELAEWLRSGKAEILDQSSAPLVDRAMVSMVKTLKRGEAGQEKTEA